LLHWSSRHAAS